MPGTILFRRSAARGGLALFAIAIAGCAHPAKVAQPAATPPGCAVYAGQASGLDPVVHTLLSICATPTGIVGTIDETGSRSGSSTREVAGLVSDDGVLHLHDVRFTQAFPRWPFSLCLAEQYTLAKDADGDVDGAFVSSPCRDGGPMALVRVR